MAEVINLRLARKAKARSEKDLNAVANRAKFGRSKGERKARQDDAKRAARELEGKRRDP